MNRRHFLGLLGAAPLAARTYFDLGASWAKHESGLWVPQVGDFVIYDLDPFAVNYREHKNGCVFINVSSVRAIRNWFDYGPIGVYCGDGTVQIGGRATVDVGVVDLSRPFIRPGGHA